MTVTALNYGTVLASSGFSEEGPPTRTAREAHAPPASMLRARRKETAWSRPPAREGPGCPVHVTSQLPCERRWPPPVGRPGDRGARCRRVCPDTQSRAHAHAHTRTRALPHTLQRCAWLGRFVAGRRQGPMHPFLPRQGPTRLWTWSSPKQLFHVKSSRFRPEPQVPDAHRLNTRLTGVCTQTGSAAEPSTDVSPGLRGGTGDATAVWWARGQRGRGAPSLPCPSARWRPRCGRARRTRTRLLSRPFLLMRLNPAETPLLSELKSSSCVHARVSPEERRWVGTAAAAATEVLASLWGGRLRASADFVSFNEKPLLRAGLESMFL